jgi:hypothetical protein
MKGEKPCRDPVRFYAVFTNPNLGVVKKVYVFFTVFSLFLSAFFPL